MNANPCPFTFSIAKRVFTREASQQVTNRDNVHERPGWNLFWNGKMKKCRELLPSQTKELQTSTDIVMAAWLNRPMLRLHILLAPPLNELRPTSALMDSSCLLFLLELVSLGVAWSWPMNNAHGYSWRRVYNTALNRFNANCVLSRCSSMVFSDSSCVIAF